MPGGISRFVKPRPGHPPSDAYNVAFAAKNGAKVVEGGERERERNEEEGEGERVRAEKTIYLFCPNERKRGLLGGQISRRRRGCGQEMGTIRSYTPEGTERRAENSWSYLAVFQRASLVYLATGGGRGDEGSRYVVERQPGSPTGSRL